MTDEYPPWDGGPDRVLPVGATTDYPTFLEALRYAGLPETAGGDIAEALANDGLPGLAGGQVVGESVRDRGRVTLWLRFFDDQRMSIRDEEFVEHEEVQPLERWRDTESAIGVLSLGFPARPIELGIIAAGQTIALPWFEYCRHYELAPQYAVAIWD